MMELQRILLSTLCLAVCISVGYAAAPKKIVRGSYAADGEFPYQVSLQDQNGHFCGGSIIDDTHILTAAHCVVSDDFVVKQPGDIHVITGVIDKFQTYPEHNVFPVYRVIYHREYNPTVLRSPDYFADIAILKLAKPIPFNSRQMPIRLPSRETPPRTRVMASGWGATFYEDDRHHESPRMLQKLEVITVPLDECNRAHRKEAVAYGQICTIAARGSAICKGDSGGPLAHNNEIIGIVSWGIACAKGVPDVFTSVHAYLPWIQSVMQLQ